MCSCVPLRRPQLTRTVGLLVKSHPPPFPYPMVSHCLFTWGQPCGTGEFISHIFRVAVKTIIQMLLCHTILQESIAAKTQGNMGVHTAPHRFGMHGKHGVRNPQIATKVALRVSYGIKPLRMGMNTTWPWCVDLTRLRRQR